MYINCINCGHKFDVGKSYDDYEGPVRCPTCRGLLTIRTVDGAVRTVRPGIVSLEQPAQQVVQAPVVQAPVTLAQAPIAGQYQPQAQATPTSEDAPAQPLPLRRSAA